MEVQQLTILAQEICAGHGLRCSYEHDAGRFAWVFYRGAARVNGTAQKRWVIPMAEKLVDKGK